MKVRIIYKPDKTVAIVHPAPKSKKESETEEQWLQRVFSKAMQGDLKGLEFDDVDKSEIPVSRENRGAWEGEKGKGITINQTKADLLNSEKQTKEAIESEKERLLEEMARNNLGL